MDEGRHKATNFQVSVHICLKKRINMDWMWKNRHGLLQRCSEFSDHHRASLSLSDPSAAGADTVINLPSANSCALILMVQLSRHQWSLDGSSSPYCPSRKYRDAPKRNWIQ